MQRDGEQEVLVTILRGEATVTIILELRALLIPL